MEYSRETSSPTHFHLLKALLLFILMLLNAMWVPQAFVPVKGQVNPVVASISPSATNWGVFVGSTGQIHIALNESGIAVRVEIPREFSADIVGENDTSFIQSDIRNDYYYYNVVDESEHWSYAWRGQNSTAPCFKPSSTFYDPNAPWCVDVWNFLNGRFLNFTVPKMLKLNLEAPQVAGIYNFTIAVADHNNSLGFPDFTHSWNETLFVPVTMKDNPGNITGTIRDCKFGSMPITNAKGIAYALTGGQVVAKAYVNEATGKFKLTGLDQSIKLYDIQASAGLFRESDGTNIAFSLTDTGSVGVGDSVDLCLQRAPQIWGTIRYLYSDTAKYGLPVPKPLTAHPWLTKAGFTALNITVEALDALGTHIYRNYTLSQNAGSDTFRIITGAGWRYPGVDAAGKPNSYGTEYAGLPQSAQLSVYAWISGYNLETPQQAIVTPPDIGPPNTGSAANVQLNMWTGSAIAGVLKFNFCTDPCSPVNQQVAPETPLNAESRIAHTQTGLLYGGNIIIEAYEHTGTSDILRGISVINGTNANGAARFSNELTVPFVMVGFSEWFNRSLTLAGGYSVASGNPPPLIPLCTGISNATLCWKDAALEPYTYSFKVYVRGYELKPSTASVSVNPGTLTELSNPLNLVEGGAVEVTVSSNDNRPKTRSLQAELPWRFLNLTIPVKARVYFYDSYGNTLGYAERLMIAGSSVNLTMGVQGTSFTVVFAGQEWSMGDILYYGQKPNFVPSGNASMSVFTLGYVQQTPGKILVPYVTLGTLTQTATPVLYGNTIGLTAPLFSDPTLYIRVPEHEHVIGEVASSGLTGAVIENLTEGMQSPLDFAIYGIGGMILNGTLVGMGHFFYVPPDAIVNPRCTNYGFTLTDANRCFDYGLDTGPYTVSVPEYGFDRHFTPLNATSQAVDFNDLFQLQSALIPLVNMAKVTLPRPDSLVVAETCDNQYLPMSWVQVEAQAVGMPIESTSTYDGNYSLFLRGGGPYVMTFSLLQLYAPNSPPLLLGNVQWSSTYSITPPAMVPVSGHPTCDPPNSIPLLTIGPRLAGSAVMGVVCILSLCERDRLRTLLFL